MLGSRATATAYPLLVLALTGSPALAGTIGFLATLPYILWQLPAGAITDRVNRRRMMVLCDVGRLLALASLPAAALLGRLTLVQVGAVAFVEGSLFVFFRLGETTAIRIVVPQPQHAEALAQNEARMRAASLLGPPVGGFLFGFGRTLPFLADALSYLVSLATLLLIREPFEEERTAAPGHPLKEVREGFSWIWEHRYVMVVNLAASATNLLFQVVVLVVIVSQERRGVSTAEIGLVLGGFGVGGLLGSIAGGWLTARIPANTIVRTTVWIWAAVTPAVAFVGPPLPLAGVLATLSFMGAAWNIAGNTIYFRLIPDRLMGRVSSVGSLTAYGALPLGSLAGGLLIQAFGPQATALVAAAGMVAVAITTSLAPSVRRGPEG